MKKIDISLAVGLVFAILLSSFTTFAKDCDNVRGSVVRLHVLANSDSKADQELKLAVRDRILDGTSDIFSPAKTKEQAKSHALDRLSEIEVTARREIESQGYNYTVKAEIVNMFFETKTYGDVTLPAGYYDAVRINIGEARGKNWWCVLFPPLCIPAAAEKPTSEEEDNINRLNSQPSFVPKFALVEAFEKFIH